MNENTNSSVSGFVTNENNNAVFGATVNFGTQNTITDEFGYFEIKNSLVSKNAALVTITKAGYFKGFKTFIVSSGQSVFFRIKLIPKIISANFSSSVGGSVNLSNGLKIQFPANAIVVSPGNASYTGTVNVAATWINPLSSERDMLMPGDLRGTDTNGELKTLRTFGMAGIELTGSSGQILQVKQGMKAQMTFPLPSSISGNAPQSIPLWYFDEVIGLWKEEGFATKIGATYVGDVNHFSFWNCDVPSDFVQFDFTLQDNYGMPVSFVGAIISDISDPTNYRYGTTNSYGFVSGAIPNNASLRLEIFSFYCSIPIYTLDFNTTNSTLSLGTIRLDATAPLARVTGTATNCAGNPLSNGFIIMRRNNLSTRYELSSIGTFNFLVNFCNTNTDTIHLKAQDGSTGQQSPGSTVPLQIGLNNAGNQQTCGLSVLEYFNLTINGSVYSFNTPDDHILFLTSTPEIYASKNPEFIRLLLSGNNISAGSTIGLNHLKTSYIPDSTIHPSPILINVTEFGAPGEYFSGNFAGRLRGAFGNNAEYNVTGNFRVRR